MFEGDAVAFPDVGLHDPCPAAAATSPNGLYHHERDQEDFLVLAGECIANASRERSGA